MIKVKVKDLVHGKSCKYDRHPGILYHCPHKKSWFHLSNNYNKSGEEPYNWDVDIKSGWGWNYAWWVANDADDSTYEGCFDETEWSGYGTIISHPYSHVFKVGNMVQILTKEDHQNFYKRGMVLYDNLSGGNSCNGISLYGLSCLIKNVHYVNDLNCFRLSVDITGPDGTILAYGWCMDSFDTYEHHGISPAKPKVDPKIGQIYVQQNGWADPVNALGEFLRNMDGTVDVLKSDISNSCCEITLPSSNHSTTKIPNPTLDTYKPSRVTTDADVKGKTMVNKKSTDEMLIMGLI